MEDDAYVRLIRLHISYAARLKQFDVLKKMLESRGGASVEFLHNEVLHFTEGVESNRHVAIPSDPFKTPFRKTPLQWAVENKNM